MCSATRAVASERYLSHDTGVTEGSSSPLLHAKKSVAAKHSTITATRTTAAFLPFPVPFDLTLFSPNIVFIPLFQQMNAHFVRVHAFTVS